MKVKLSNIDWDTDGENVDLPSEMIVDVDDINEAVDAASNITCWCINNANVEIVDEKS